MGTCYTLYCPEKKTALYIGKAKELDFIGHDTVQDMLVEAYLDANDDEEPDRTWYLEFLARIAHWAEREGVSTYQTWNDCSGKDEPWIDYSSVAASVAHVGWSHYDAVAEDLVLDWNKKESVPIGTPLIEIPEFWQGDAQEYLDPPNSLDKVKSYLQLVGNQTHPSFAGQSETFHSQNAKMADACRDSLAQCLDNGWPTPWSLQLLEQVHRAMATKDDGERQAVLLQVAATAVAWMDGLVNEAPERDADQDTSHE